MKANYLPQIRCSCRLQDAPASAKTINGPEVIRRLWKCNIATARWFDPCKEHFVVFALNTRYRPHGWNLISIGSLDESLTNPREIFRPLIFVAAYGFVLAHNHPSGDPRPSRVDLISTGRIAACGATLGIALIDHVIIGAGKRILSMRGRFGKQWERFAEGHLPKDGRR